MEKSLLDDKRLAALKKLSGFLHYHFRDISLLATALVHRSFRNENPHYQLGDNERFEYLGDAVLSLSASDLIYRKYPLLTEGALTKIRSALISETTLAQIAGDLRVGDYLLLGRGEEKSAGRNKASLLANAMEAIFAAIYLDSGFKKADNAIKFLLEPILSDAEFIQQYFDYKSALQEFCQRVYKTKPNYEVIEQRGPEHSVTFTVRLTIDGILKQTAAGKNKKDAEKKAAQNAWKIIQGKSWN